MSSSTDTSQDDSSMNPQLFWAACGVVAWYTLYWCVALLGWCVARNLSWKRRPSPLASLPPNQVPGVSIIRPLKGLDANLFENVESSFKQDYPKFQVLLSVAEASDPAIPVIKELLKMYPQVDATLIIGEEVVGVNPKVNNLVRPFQAARYDILWVVDSNVQISRGALARAVDVLDPPETCYLPDKPGTPRVGLVHHVPLALSTANILGARIEEAFLNTNLAKMYLAINALAIESCVVGKSNLYRKSDINRLTATFQPQSKSPILPPPGSSKPRLTGLAAFGRFLAEDNAIAAALWRELDVRHVIACDVALNVIGDMDIYGYISRRIRWIRLRKNQTLIATVIEPFTESVLLGLLAAWAAYSLFSVPYAIFLPTHFILWLMVDLDILATLGGDALPQYKFWSFVQAWVYRELLAFPVWLFGVLGNEVDWRGQRYRITYRGEAVKIA